MFCYVEDVIHPEEEDLDLPSELYSLHFSSFTVYLLDNMAESLQTTCDDRSVN